MTSEQLRIAIDASNLGSGGAIRHIVELIGAADPGRDGFSQIHLLAPEALLAVVPERHWLIKHRLPMNPRRIVRREIWRMVNIRRWLRFVNADVVLCPGGMPIFGFRPWVSVCQNVLPFSVPDVGARNRKHMVYLWLLRLVQRYSFERADGVIFLSNFAKTLILRDARRLRRSCIIPFGVGQEFRSVARSPRVPSANTVFTYVSPCDFYKNHKALLRSWLSAAPRMPDAELWLIGGGDWESLRSSPEFAGLPISVRFLGAIPPSEVAGALSKTDVFVFLSACENLPNALLEAAVAGLPILASDRGPHREILRESATFVDPDDVTGIEHSLVEIFESLGDSDRLVDRPFLDRLSWENCASETFKFLREALPA